MPVLNAIGTKPRAATSAVAVTPVCTMPVMVMSIANGITAAVRSAASDRLAIQSVVQAWMEKVGGPRSGGRQWP